MPPPSPVSASTVAVLAMLFVSLLAGCGGEKRPAAPTAPASEQQQWSLGATSMATWAISPTVMVTFITRGESTRPQPPPSPPPSGPVTLELMVLWRGAPGWFLKGGQQSSSGGGDDKGHVNVRLEQAGVVLEVNLDRPMGMAHIGGQEVVLGDANVIMVDDVDVPGGLHVAGTRSVDPRTQALPDGVYTVLRGAPDLISFLRCEARLPEPAGFMQQVLDASCARMVVK